MKKKVIPMRSPAPTVTPAFADSVMKANSNLNFVQRYQRPKAFPVIQTNTIHDPNYPKLAKEPNSTYSTHLMANAGNRIYPTVVQTPKGGLKYLGNGDAAWNYADKTGEYITLKDSATADAMASNGYKQASQDLTVPAPWESKKTMHFKSGGKIPMYQSGGSVNPLGQDVPIDPNEDFASETPSFAGQSESNYQPGESHNVNTDAMIWGLIGLSYIFGTPALGGTLTASKLAFDAAMNTFNPPAGEYEKYKEENPAGSGRLGYGITHPHAWSQGDVLDYGIESALSLIAPAGGAALEKAFAKPYLTTEAKNWGGSVARWGAKKLAGQTGKTLIKDAAHMSEIAEEPVDVLSAPIVGNLMKRNVIPAMVNIMGAPIIPVSLNAAIAMRQQQLSNQKMQQATASDNTSTSNKIPLAVKSKVATQSSANALGNFRAMSGI